MPKAKKKDKHNKEEKNYNYDVVGRGPELSYGIEGEIANGSKTLNSNNMPER